MWGCHRHTEYPLGAGKTDNSGVGKHPRLILAVSRRKGPSLDRTWRLHGWCARAVFWAQGRECLHLEEASEHICLPLPGRAGEGPEV